MEQKLNKMEQSIRRRGHIYCILCILIWGSTIVSAKVAMEYLTAGELLLYRAVISYIALWVMMPKMLKLKNLKEEFLTALCGVSGVCLYYFFQNMALAHTTASDVSIIISISPMFTALILFLMDRKQNPGRWFVIGFFVSMIGVILVVLNGKFEFGGNMVGDGLALLATFSWAIYCVLVKLIPGYNIIMITRRMTFYGLLAMIPIAIVGGVRMDLHLYLQPAVLLNAAYLGVFGSAVAQALWNSSVLVLGSVMTNTYLYALPVSTIAFAIVLLHEHLSVSGFIGVLITIAGLMISQKKA